MALIKQVLFAFNKFNVALGKLVSWLLLIMVITVFGVVVLRYVFSVGWISVSYTHLTLPTKRIV